MCHGIREEFDTIGLGDRRLNVRAKKVLETLAADPQSMINAACQGWAETQAAYRFFDNDLVTLQAVLEPHRQASIKRIRRQDVVLIVQDTTELDFRSHPPRGSGPLRTLETRGFYDHSHLALTPEGLPLGVVGAEIYARSEEEFGKSKERQYDPIETKETYRWLKGYRLAGEVQKQTPETQIVSVADCEGDLYEIYAEARDENIPVDYVFRAGKTRSLPELDADASGRTYRKIQQEICEAPVVLQRELDLPKTPKREARTAQLEIRAKRMRLKAPHGKAALGEVEMNIVLVSEIDPPADGTEVKWLLITSLPIDTIAQVERVIQYYTGRWPIEPYFRTLKTGCTIEKIQLETSERLLPCLILYKIIAWRVMYATMLGRECPDLPCDVLYTESEWKPVWRIVKREEPLPKTPPSLKTFTAMLAELGGHNGRTNDDAPGPKSIWVGIRRMTDFALAWIAFGPKEGRLVCN